MKILPCGHCPYSGASVCPGLSGGSPPDIVFHGVTGQPQARQTANVLDRLHIVVPAELTILGRGLGTLLDDA